MNPDNNREHQQPEVQPQKPKTQPKLASFRQKLANLKNSYVEHALDRVPVKEITGDKVAETILKKLGNPLQERMGHDRYANPFDITNIITNLGYIGTWASTDYLKKFPEVYSATRQALFSLEQAGALESRDANEPNHHGETKYYRVVDIELLKDIIEKAKQAKKE